MKINKEILRKVSFLALKRIFEILEGKAKKRRKLQRT